ncbi:MAG TPA: hypothetical protein VG963_23265, partial [Polyangiaceae bacterium]|nr:hypothetical protein [Polyangiaceae bacterium]
TYRVGPVAISWQSLLLAAFVVIALPQALYLITRNITFVTSDGGFALHKDEFLFGSAGNSGVPGNPIHRIRGAYWGELWYQPFAQGLAWLLGIVWGVRAMSRERDVTTLGLFGFYLFCSLACMAKGIPGIALPGLIAGLHMLVTRRISWLVAGRLRVGMGILIIAVTGLPWYVAMYARLGHFFTDRLLVHDHFKRLAAGVHGDTGNIGYFLQQLGYGLFPWIGLAPLAMVTALAVEPIPNMTRSRRTAILLALWLAVSFALFNAMITKLHHYIFPAVPPSSLLIGLVLDRMLFQSKLTADNQSRRERWAIALSGSAPLPLIIGIAGLCGNLRGIIPEDVVAAERAAWISEHRLPAVLSLLAIAVGLVLLALAIRQLRTSKIGPLRACAANASVGATLLAAAVLTGSVGRDLTQVFKGRSVGQERLIGLFAYGHDRPFPEHIDYRPILTGFSVVVFGLLLTAAIAQLRQASIYALLGTSFWFSVWVLDIYIADLTPHWGQRELVKRYYEERSSPEEPLIDWQLHWRGENFYTGNRVHAYVADDNEEIQRWIATHAGQRAFVLLKRSRLEDFQNMLGARHVQARSTERENNKFILVHVDL